MRITLHTDYALRVLIYLALAEERRVTVAEIARAYDVSANHLSKVVAMLQRQGYVRTTRGKCGGIGLRRAPQEIVLGEVVWASEGGAGVLACFADPGACRIAPYCRLRGALDRAMGGFYAVLDGYTLADLVGGVPRAGLLARLGMEPE